MKILGAEFMDWYDNHWPEGDWCHEDSEVKTHDDDGNWLLVPHEKYDADDLGYLSWGAGRDTDPTDGEGMSISTCIRKWRRERDFDFVVTKVKRNA